LISVRKLLYPVSPRLQRARISILPDEQSEISDMTVKLGESRDISVRSGKVKALPRIVIRNRFGEGIRCRRSHRAIGIEAKTVFDKTGNKRISGDALLLFTKGSSASFFLS
jgi:hypothetical protein